MEYAVIMAGGTGKRLWPLSREKRPKQVLELFDGQTLLRRCFDRLSRVFDSRNIIVLTNAGYADIVRENVPDIPYDNVIAEPAVRDTAGAIGLAATILTKYDSDATMAVVTADQIIEPVDVFQQAVKDAMAFVDAVPEALVTFGIKPAFASTQLGYVKLGKAYRNSKCRNAIYSVEGFREKPTEKTAARYVHSGDYFWNSGMFVWKAQTILANLKKLLPETVEPLDEIHKAWDSPLQEEILEESFPRLPKISIDYAVMEKSHNVHAIKLNCRWLDMGSFASLAEVITSDKDNNVIVAETSELLDCKDSIIVTEQKGHLIAAIGLENMVVAHSSDATLICHIDQTQRLKELLALMKEHGRDRFL